MSPVMGWGWGEDVGSAVCCMGVSLGGYVEVARAMARPTLYGGL
ncbi:MAG: hypothetical protein RI897_1952 [Verrucomicrobiota bacterium]